MFVKTNTLKEIKSYFFSSLKNKYEEREVESLFMICTEEILGLTRMEIRANKVIILRESELLDYNKVVKKLKKHVPIQYIFGKAPFYDREFLVDENVLIPRQETEELIQLIVNQNKSDSPKILDIGTGSGIIAISLDLEIPNSEVTGIDVSEGALKIAEQNKDVLGSNVTFLEQNILDESLWKSNDKYDIIVSNPPYVLESEKELMRPNVLENEPHLALFVEDENPLLFYIKIVNFAIQKLKPNGILYFEINEKYGQDVADLMKGKVEIIKDLNGKDRFVYGIFP